ncbi:MAG TPA: MFS transporter [Pseudomonadales bacterium]|nr:MFS transporter [Pseudomonadales bacterium]
MTYDPDSAKSIAPLKFAITDSVKAPEQDAKQVISSSRAGVQLACVILGYIGVYLCRKNFGVAVPLLQSSFHVDKAQIGAVDSYATIAYAAGKFFWGPNVIDRFGGKICFFLLLTGVAIFSGASAFATTLPMLALFYMANRFCGSGGWESMVKMVPDWFPARHMALAMAFLSLSFVFGGVCAVLLAGQVAAMTGNNWRAMMGFPSIVLLGIIGICWIVLSREKKLPHATAAGKSEWKFSRIFDLAKIPQFWIVCGLSFVLTITRETFNVWTVDFLKTDAHHMSTRLAALLSTPFDAMGAVGILLLGWILDRLSPRKRNWLLFGILTAVAALIFGLPFFAHMQLWVVVTAIGLIGFLSYGPYSLLAGVLAVEIRGKDFVATVAGLVDASGYVAGIVSGYCFGWILDHGGYQLGFHVLGVTTLAAALLCLVLYGRNRNPSGQVAKT